MQYVEKIAQMDAASPRKILDRNKSQIGQLQKQLDELGEERRDLVHMVELLNEKHHATRTTRSSTWRALLDQ